MKVTIAMRLVFLLIWLCTTLCKAQTPLRLLHIETPYTEQKLYTEQAVERIDAVNKIGELTNVEYKAGYSISLLPGFETIKGGTFVTNIRPVSEFDGDERLTLVTFPNPFSQSVVLEYYLPMDGKVTVWIQNIQGKRIEKLVYQLEKQHGQYRYVWNAEKLQPGIYMASVELNNQKVTERLIKVE